MGITFSIVDKDGRTPVEDPRRAAYSYMALLARRGLGYCLEVRDGEFTVKSPGLMTLIFVPLED